VDRIPDIMHDPIWQVLGVFLAIAAIAIAMALRHRKSLVYIIDSVVPLLVGVKSVQSKLRIFYGNKRIKLPYVLIIRIFNSGNQPVKPDDYVDPITISFTERTKIISAEILREHPQNLSMKLNFDTKDIKLAPVLLNPKDSFTLKLIVDDFDNDIEIKARIAGIKSIKNYSFDVGRSLGFTILFGISISLLVTLVFTVWLKLVTLREILSFAVLFIVYGIIHTIIHLSKDYQKRQDPSRIDKY